MNGNNSAKPDLNKENTNINMKNISGKSENSKQTSVLLHNNIAVAIPYKNAEQAKKDYEEATLSGANMIEFRLDYSDNLRLNETNQKKDIEEIFPSMELKSLINSTLSTSKSTIKSAAKSSKKSVKIPIIFTLRRKDQGGQYEILENKRIEYVKYLMDFKPDYFDLEADINPDILRELNELAKEKGISIIYSEHDWSKTPAIGKIKKIANELLARCPDIMPINEKIHNRNVLKIIFTAQNISDNYVVLEICKHYAQKNIKIVCFCMGAEGIPSRVGSLLCGGFFSFASIGEATAPGQISISEFFDYLESAKEGIK